MKLLRWNNARPQGPQRKKAEPRASHSGQGLEVKKSFSTSGRGEIFFLTFPFIDQAVTLTENRPTTRPGQKVLKGIFRQLTSEASCKLF